MKNSKLEKEFCILRDRIIEKEFKHLNQQQKSVLLHGNGPALTISCPGSGKTTVLLNRLYYLTKFGPVYKTNITPDNITEQDIIVMKKYIDYPSENTKILSIKTINLILKYKVNPARILSITFSRASAKDMKERFSKNFEEISSFPINFSTIHSFCFSLIREYAYIKRIKYTLIEDDKHHLNKYNLIKKIYLDINKEYITEEKLETLLNSIGYIKNMLISVDEFLKNNKVDIDNFKIIYNTYEEYKRDNSLLDFDDMLTVALEILMKDEYLLEKYRSKFDYIQVDEGQDTSKAQMEIIKLLAYPKNNLFIVADDDQSIYGFRGAYPKGLFDFNKNYSNGKLFLMEQNYRSSRNIVSVCNRFIKKNALRYNKNISTENKYIEPINIIKVDTIADQYKYLLEEIKNRDSSNSCILFRNNLSAIGIIELFERNKIPFYMRDVKVRFFNHWLVQDIINFMIFAQDTSNMNIYENIYYKKKGYISKKQINYAKTLNYSLCVFDRILDFPGLSEFYKRILRELKLDFKKLSKMSPGEAINYIEYDLEYEKYLKENSMRFGYTYDSLKTILYYLKLIANRSENLNDFLGRLKYLQHLCLNSKNNKNSITLSTVHSAKGLEFDRVYMIDLIDGDFPTIGSIEAFEKGKFDLLEEERRLFYVGMTRAKYHLSLVSMNKVGNKIVSPSRFLLELEEGRV